MICPNCKEEIEEDKLNKEYDKSGRKAKCPLCKKWIIFLAFPRNLVPDKNNPNSMVRRFKNVKQKK